MRFTSAIVAGIFAVAASAQSTSAAVATPTSNIDPAQESLQAEMIACIEACKCP